MTGQSKSQGLDHPTFVAALGILPRGTAAIKCDVKNHFACYCVVEQLLAERAEKERLQRLLREAHAVLEGAEHVDHRFKRPGRDLRLH